MNSPRDLRRRIKSVSGTSQITKAMQMVAASKMRKAQLAATASMPFARLLYRIQVSATSRMREFNDPLLTVRPVRKRAVILVAADKGLCGALNTNVFRLASQFDQASTVYITAGRKAAQFVARTQRQLIAEFPYGDSPTFAEARAIAGKRFEELVADISGITVMPADDRITRWSFYNYLLKMDPDAFAGRPGRAWAPGPGAQ
jgi:F-type H+-transporting ATPase subunit gamma